MKTSKIKEIKYVREYEGKFGKMYVYFATLENAEYGEIQTKTLDKYRNGEEIKYELTSRSDNFGKTVWQIKIMKEENDISKKSYNPERENLIVRQSSLKAAIDLCCSSKIPVEKVIEWAEFFVTFVNKK